MRVLVASIALLGCALAVAQVPPSAVVSQIVSASVIR